MCELGVGRYESHVMAVQAGKFGGGLAHRNDAPMQGVKTHGTLQLLDHGRAQHPCASRSLHQPCHVLSCHVPVCTRTRGHVRGGRSLEWPEFPVDFFENQGAGSSRVPGMLPGHGSPGVRSVAPPLPTYILSFTSLFLCALVFEKNRLAFKS